MSAATRGRKAFYNEIVPLKGDSMLRSIGPTELIVIIIVIVLLFGGKKIPELAKGLGEGIRHFKGAIKHEEEEAAEANKHQVERRWPPLAVWQPTARTSTWVH